MASKLAKRKYKQQKKCCFYCGNPMINRQNKGRIPINKTGWTKDHFFPRSLGGGNNWNNMVLACVRCNREKGDRLPTEAEIKKFIDIFPEMLFWMQNNLNRFNMSVKTF